VVLTGYDAAFAPAHPPATDVVAFYGPGGDQEHAWPLSDIEAQSARYRAPIFVRSNPGQASVTTDAETFMSWLVGIGCPKGSLTVLDLETAIAPNYVNVYGQLLRSEGYLVAPYGSSGTLYKNPALDGYWVDLPGATAIPSNCIGVQYAQGGGGAWDLSWWNSGLPFWDTRPPIIEEEQMPYAVINKAGTGYIIATDLSHKTGIPDPADWATLKTTGNYQVESFTDALIDNIPGS
jgi:hypothetical protein